jgi:hypothetical protein
MKSRSNWASPPVKSLHLSVGTPDSREERTPDGKLTIGFRANGRTLEYRVNDMTRMTWD